jgi:hypothetical protein
MIDWKEHRRREEEILEWMKEQVIKPLVDRLVAEEVISPPETIEINFDDGGNANK